MMINFQPVINGHEHQTAVGFNFGGEDVYFSQFFLFFGRSHQQLGLIDKFSLFGKCVYSFVDDFITSGNKVEVPLRPEKQSRILHAIAGAFVRLTSEASPEQIRKTADRLCEVSDRNSSDDIPMQFKVLAQRNGFHEHNMSNSIHLIAELCARVKEGKITDNNEWLIHGVDIMRGIAEKQEIGLRLKTSIELIAKRLDEVLTHGIIGVVAAEPKLLPRQALEQSAAILGLSVTQNDVISIIPNRHKPSTDKRLVQSHAGFVTSRSDRHRPETSGLVTVFSSNGARVWTQEAVASKLASQKSPGSRE